VAVLVIWILAEIKKHGSRKLLDSRSNVESLRAMTWQEFERLVGESYRRRGYIVHETGGGGADGGVDLVLEKNGEQTLVQCKQWKSWKVGVKIVRELYGVVAALNAGRGAIVCCGRFTEEAKMFAADKPLDLIDGDKLWAMIVEVKKNVPAARAPSNSVQQQAPAVAETPTCPKCGAPMVLRTARKGQRAGSRFYGCSKYPECRGIVSV